MKRRTLLGAIAFVLWAALPAIGQDKLFESEASDGVVIPLGVESGSANDRGRDTRVFTILASVSGEKGSFTWNGSGQTYITAAYAKRINAKVAESEDLKGYLGADGKPLFLGDSAIELEFGGKKHLTTVFVIRDGELGSKVVGMIGHDVARAYQWEVDPRKPKLTLRPPGTPLKKEALATVPVKEDSFDLSVHVKVRGVEEDMTLQLNAPYLQAAEKLQQAWETANVGKPAQESKFGNVRMILMAGDKDTVEFSEKVIEHDIPALLLADGGTAKSGLGAALMNRFVYSIDPMRNELALIERVAPGKK